jgi:hypothetical protein
VTSLANRTGLPDLDAPADSLTEGLIRELSDTGLVASWLRSSRISKVPGWVEAGCGLPLCEVGAFAYTRLGAVGIGMISMPRKEVLMNLSKELIVVGLFALLAGFCHGETFDTVVVGATAGGVGAAIAAGRQGLRVALIEDSPVLGGMISNGVSTTNLMAHGASSGIFEEFRLRCRKYHEENFPNDPTMKISAVREGFHYAPSLADRTFKQMIAEIPTVKVFYGRHATKVLKEANRVTGVVTRDNHEANEITFRAPITIDATTEGDLLPLAGVKFRLGREPRSAEEPHAGVIYMTLGGEVFGSGEGDDKIQAFAMLLIFKDYGPGADKTIPRPPGFDPKRYAPEQKDQTAWFNGGKALPGKKYTVNENLDGTDMAEFAQHYITASRAERQRIWDKYRDYSLGYLYFRQTVMGEKNIGLADDEYTDNGNLPYSLYVREGRRMEGVYMFNERDAIRVPGFPRPPFQKDSIASADWDIDPHAVSRDTDGYMYLGLADRFHISAPVQAPYGVIVPKNVDGLLVPMAVSATHIGFQVLRLEPGRVALGQAAGNAAALCVKQRIQPRQVSVRQLQKMLLDQGQALFYYKDVTPSTPNFRAIQEIGMANIDPGGDDFSFRPGEKASQGDLAKYLFHGLNLKLRMDYTDLWKVMHWEKNWDKPGKRVQYCTPEHWATYYLLTLYNMGAFNDDFLAGMNPDAACTRSEMVKWASTAVGARASANPILVAEAAKKDGSITRSELARFIQDLRESR